MPLDLTDDIGVFNKSSLKDDMGIFNENKKLTGNPSVDMASANESIATAQKNTQPLEILNKVTGYPYTNPKIISNNVSNIASGAINTLKNPSVILNAATHPVDAISSYISKYSKENIKNTINNDPIGVVLDATMIGGLANIGTKAAIKSIPVTTPEQMVAKAESITQRILNPSKDVIADSLLKNSTIPAVREAAKVIKKSPNEKALLANMDEAIKTNFAERDAIINSNNYRMTDNHIKELEAFINDRKSSGQINPQELRQMENVLSEEKAWYVKNKDSFDRVAGQTRKEYLQDITKTLIENRADGVKTITQPARKQALDVLRSGLMKEVEGNDLRVRELNSTYAGLKDAKEMLANQAAIVEQNVNRGMLDRALLVLEAAKNPQAAAINLALKNSKNISKTSSQVEKLMAKAGKNKIKQVINDAIKNENILGLPNLTPKYISERQSMEIKGLGIKTSPSKNRTFQTGGIPNQEQINL